MVHAGDVICFSGDDWASDAINIVTLGLPRRSIHHVGIVSYLHGKPLIYEAIGSDTSRPIPCVRQGRVCSGFQAHYLDSVEDLVTGRVYHLPLRCELYDHEADRLAYYLDSLIGKPYDKLSAARSGGAMFRILESLVRPEDTSSLFCSESVAAALVHIGRFQTRSASMWNPNALCRALRREGVVGEYRRLK